MSKNLLAQLLIGVGIDASKMKSGAREVESESKNATDKAAGSFENMAASVQRSNFVFNALGTAAGFLGGEIVTGLADKIVEFGRDTITAAENAQAGLAQTFAVLQSTGQAANITADGLGNLIEKLSNTSAVSQEQVRQNENLLLTFTDVKNQVGLGNNVFDQASQTILDMSRALGEDGKSAAIQLGKALQDPILGMTALRRVGVEFTSDQQKAIKSMVESGDLLGAQKTILAELTHEFGNSASAFGQTGAGQAQRFRNSIEELQISIGNGVIPILGTLASSIQPLIGNLNEWVRGNQPLLDQIGQFAGGLIQGATAQLIRLGNEAFPIISNAIRTAVPIVQSLWEKLGQLVTQVGPPLLTAVQNAVGVVGAFFAAFGGKGRDSLDSLWQTALPLLRSGAQDLAGALGFLRDHMEQLKPVIEAVVIAMVAWDVVTTAMTVGGAIAGLVTFVAAAIETMTVLAGAEGEVTIAQWLWNLAMDANPIGAIIVGIVVLITVIVLLVTHWNQVHAVITNVWNRITDLVSSHKALFAALVLLSGPVGWIITAAILIVTHWGAVSTFFRKLPAEIGGFFSALGTKVRDGINAVGGFFDQLGTRLHNALGAVVAFAENIWKQFSERPLYWILRLVLLGPSLIQRLGTAIATWMVNFVKDHEQQWKDWLARAIAVVKALPGLILDQLIDLWNRWVAWREQFKADASAGFQAFVKNAIAEIQALPGQALSLFEGLTTSLGKWASDLATNATTWGKNFASSLLSEMQALPGEVLGIGSGIATGVWHGLTSTFQDILSKIPGLGGQMVQAFRDAFGIQSPSRVMAEMVGRPIMQGLALGIDSEGSARSAVARQVAALSAVGFSRSGLAFAGASGGSVASMRRSGPTINVTVHNPTPEPASTSVTRQLRILAATGRLS